MRQQIIYYRYSGHFLLSFLFFLIFSGINFPAITPARNSIRQPMMCPTMIPASPFPMPSGARYVPVRISAIETPAPNQIRPL